jgi:hypothetical protein
MLLACESLSVALFAQSSGTIHARQPLYSKSELDVGAPWMTYLRSAGVILGLALAVTWNLVAYAETRSKEDLEKEYHAASFRAVARDAFPVLFDPRMGNVADGDRFLRPSDWVIGIVLNGQSKAYPITVMGFHELINDTVGGAPIAVCW